MEEKQFELGDNAHLTLSGEAGIVIGKAEYLYETRKYLVQYVAADGRQVENWFAGPQLA